METEEKRKLLNEFLETWPEARVRKMTIGEYVGVEDKNTFTYWVETGMRDLGSIKGMTSIKFGIYKRDPKKKKPKINISDSEYTWRRVFGEKRQEAFENVRDEILQIIKYAESGDFAKIDDLHLSDLFKWKVASLYSNERLVPIFKRAVLDKVATAFGLKDSKKKKISELQELLISKRPAELDVYTYMESLYDQYGHEGGDKKGAPKKEGAGIGAERKPAAHKNTDPQLRTVARTYIAEQKHNRIQEALYNSLVAEHGEGKVFREKNYVDVTLELPDQVTFYEVKPYSSVLECIREALGQVLAYAFRNAKDDDRKRKIVAVGQYPPNEGEQKFVEFIKSLLSIEFDYENVAI
jgi:hypothetical protein